MSKGIKFVGNIEDHDGYGRACYSTANALLRTNLPLSIKIVSWVKGARTAVITPELKKRVNAKAPYDTVLIESVPPAFAQHAEKGKKNIGYFFWETDKICASWVKFCNAVDEIWVPCETNKTAVLNSGVTVPVKVLPQAIITPNVAGKIFIPDTTPFTYVFYSLFQWNPRKNWKGLLEAYWSAFTRNDDVRLMIKTYGQFPGTQGRSQVINDIEQARRVFLTRSGRAERDLPLIFLVPDILSDDQIQMVHNSGHCFVSTSFGEGWQVATATAITLGYPIISSTFGGVVDMLEKDKFFSLSHTMAPVSGMPWVVWYDATQQWANPSMEEAASHMRHCYESKIKSVDYGTLPAQLSLDAMAQNIKLLLESK